MTSREQFEKWMRAQPHVLNLGRHLPDGKYVLPEDETAWQAWEASRTAIVIELPKRADTGVDTGGWPIDSGSHRINCVIAQCAMAIGAAGLRVSQP